jgi:hypothetical protein
MFSITLFRDEQKSAQPLKDVIDIMQKDRVLSKGHGMF